MRFTEETKLAEYDQAIWQFFLLYLQHNRNEIQLMGEFEQFNWRVICRITQAN